MNYYEIAKGEIGVREIEGGKSNPRVMEYFKKVGHSWVKDDSTAWCAAYVGWCLEMAGIKSTRKLNARSYLKLGTEVKTPQKGDIVILWRVKKNSAYGHVAFFEGFTPDGNLLLLGGNQSNEVNISEYPISRLLGYRRIQNNLESIEELKQKIKQKDEVIKILGNMVMTLLSN